MLLSWAADRRCHPLDQLWQWGCLYNLWSLFEWSRARRLLAERVVHNLDPSWGGHLRAWWWYEGRWGHRRRWRGRDDLDCKPMKFYQVQSGWPSSCCLYTWCRFWCCGQRRPLATARDILFQQSDECFCRSYLWLTSVGAYFPWLCFCNDQPNCLCLWRSWRLGLSS